MESETADKGECSALGDVILYSESGLTVIVLWSLIKSMTHEPQDYDLAGSLSLGCTFS